MYANTSLLFSLITIYCKNANRVFFYPWLEAMDKGLFTGVVMIDLRKAFDVVDHKLLLKKRQVYGLNTNSLKWFQGYLSGR